MASKKCPKCGEDNPAEAVMCWACYTPLSGSAPLGAGLTGAAGTLPKGAGSPVGVPLTEEPAKKGLDPKAIGIGAFLLVGVIAAVMMSGMMGGGGGEEGGASPTPIPDGVGGGGGHNHLECRHQFRLFPVAAAAAAQLRPQFRRILQPLCHRMRNMKPALWES